MLVIYQGFSSCSSGVAEEEAAMEVVKEQERARPKPKTAADKISECTRINSMLDHLYIDTDRDVSRMLCGE